MNSDTADFLSTLLQLADTGERDTRHVKAWAVHEFHPEFVAAVDSFLSGFRGYLERLAGNGAEDSEAFEDPDSVCRGTFGGNVFLSLSGHGAGFWDTDESKPLQDALEAYAGGKHRFESLSGSLLAKFSGKIHLAFRSKEARRRELAHFFSTETAPWPKPRPVDFHQLCLAADASGKIKMPNAWRGFVRRAKAAYKRNLADPGDCKGMPDLLAALAIAEAHTGRGPGWIPFAQKIACELAELPTFKTFAAQQPVTA